MTAEVFCYSTKALLEALDTLTAERGQLGDYGEDLVPWFVENRRAVAHQLTGYWMDLGTLQSYWTAHLQLIDGDGATLDDPDWPIYSAQPQLLPARYEKSCKVADALIAAGSCIGGHVQHSVLGPKTVVEQGASVRDCVLLDGVHLGTGSGVDELHR